LFIARNVFGLGVMGLHSVMMEYVSTNQTCLDSRPGLLHLLDPSIKTHPRSILTVIAQTIASHGSAASGKDSREQIKSWVMKVKNLKSVISYDLILNGIGNTLGSEIDPIGPGE